jgi:hypothetical protein
MIGPAAKEVSLLSREGPVSGPTGPSEAEGGQSSTNPNTREARMTRDRIVTTIAVALLSVGSLAPRVVAADMDGVMMKDGKMMMMMGGKATGPMDKEMTMSDGTKVKPDGSMMMKDGKMMKMKNGQMMMMDGKMTDSGKAMEKK